MPTRGPRSDTDWPAIAATYGRLLEFKPTPVIALNRAVAVAMADGPHAGLTLMNELSRLDSYHLYWAARGELLLRAGDPEAAAAALRRARDLATNPTEVRHLDRRIASAAHPGENRR